jgi:penicillin-insensitive murein endopeptidase
VWRRWSLLAAGGVALAGCIGQGLVDDGTSVSFGPPNDGALLNPASLPPSGAGYRMPPTWARRGLNHGTAELVSLIEHLGRALEQHHVGRPLAVADLSRELGGPSAWHRSHQTGRDVDLLYFVRDASGKPIVPDVMRHYGEDGASIPEAPGDPVWTFDDHANWLAVRELVVNPVADVQWIFISEALRQRLLDHAIVQGEPLEVIAAAAQLLHQPGGAPPHDDHMHVRVYCAPTDVRQGCEEIGPLRWYKKTYKYRGRGGESGPAAGSSGPTGARS